MLSLGVALVLTVPVILYPSTEMLEVWLDERTDERLRKIEADASMTSTSFQHLGGPQPLSFMYFCSVWIGTKEKYNGRHSFFESHQSIMHLPLPVPTILPS